MKKYYIRYALEFLVITLGVTLSFFMEYRREKQYKEQLKEQSLSRIYENISSNDIPDFELNIRIHEMSIRSAEWIFDHHDQFNEQMRDSIGYHVMVVSNMGTVLVDNQEEYRSLQNSGLIELIANEDLVKGLQNKYTVHNFIKKIEDYNNEMYMQNLQGFARLNMLILSKESTEFYLPVRSQYTGDLQLPDSFLYDIRLKTNIDKQYISLVQQRLLQDRNILDQIETEIK